MKSKAYAGTTGTIFLGASLLHLWRLLGEFEIQVGGGELPSWGSMIIVAAGGYLSYTGFRIATRS